MSSNKASMPQLRPFHFGTHLLGNNFYLQPCLMCCSISTARNQIGEKKKKSLLNGQYHCKVPMIYNTVLWLFYHAPSGKTAVLVREATFLTWCPLTGTHMPLNKVPEEHCPDSSPPPKEKSKEEKSIKAPWHSFKIVLAQAFSPRGAIEMLINVSAGLFLLGKSVKYDKINDH